MDNTNNDEGGKKAPGVMGPPIGGRSQDILRAGRGRGRKQSEPIPSWSRSDRTRCAWCMKQLDFNPIRATSPQSSVVSCSGGCETNYCSMQHRDQDFERHKPFCSLHIPSSSCSNSTPAMTRLGANTTDDVLQSETSWRKASHDTSSSSGYRSGGNSFVMSSSERSLGFGDSLVPVSSWSDIAGTDKTPLSLGALHETQTSDSDFLSVRFASSPNQRNEIERNTQNAAAESHTDNIEIIDATKSTSQTSSCAVDHSLNQPHVEPGEPDIGLVNATNSGNVQRLKRLAEHATTCLQLYGWSVLDKFIGAHNCANVLIDVQSIRDRGLLMPGQLMGGGPMGDAAQRQAQALLADFQPRTPDVPATSTHPHETSPEQQTLSANAEDGQAMQTVRYRALYEFQARNDDELSFQPGDTILVFKDHHAEPGWLAGQVREKVGWFPEAFAECIDTNGVASEADATANEQVGVVSPSGSAGQKLDRIDETSGEDQTAAVANANGVANAAADSTAATDGTTNETFGDTAFDDDFGKSAGAATAQETEKKLVMAQATYPWKAKKESHLSVQKGDVIKILEMQEMWYLGELNGVQGLLPKSCVRLVDAAKFAPAAADSTSTPTDNTAAAAAAATPASSESGEWCVALYPFTTAESGDLGFEAGERIFVTSKDGDWWSGKIGDRQGIFPASYVQSDAASARPQSASGSVASATESGGGGAQQQLEIGKVIAPFAAGAANQLSLKQGDLIQIRAKSPTGWFEGELQRKGEERRTGWFPGNYVKIIKKAGGGSQTASMHSSHSTTPTQKGGDTVEALYDYTPAHDDELQFSAGDVITVTERKDADWWVGTTSDGRSGIFPANYVQSSSSHSHATTSVKHQSNTNYVDPGATISETERRRAMHAQELIDTEKNYMDDLAMVDDVFRKPLYESGQMKPDDLNRVFSNWLDLIALSNQLQMALRRDPQNIGSVLLHYKSQLHAFITFCEAQQYALNLVQRYEQTQPMFRGVYERCKQNPVARGLGLSYYLLLPMTRVTKYPLVLQQILKYTDNVHPDHQVLYKAKSNRLLVGLLFNDVLMLTTPDRSIEDVESFKINNQLSEISLTVYKQPILLHQASLLLSAAATGGAKADDAIAITFGDTTVNLRTVSSNARIMWHKQLDKTIQVAKAKHTELVRDIPMSTDIRGIGRLLIELVSVDNVVLPTTEFGATPVVKCVMTLNNQRQTRPIDLSSNRDANTSLCSTQFIIDHSSTQFHLSILAHRPFAPDIAVGRVQLNVSDLIQASSAHRGPIRRQLHLSGCELYQQQTQVPVLIKFVVQMFE